VSGPPPLSERAPYPEADEIRLSVVMDALRRSRWLILATTVLGAVLGAASGLASKNRYIASGSFIAQLGDARVSGAAGLARQFGVDIGGGKSGQSPQFYASLLRRPAVLRRAVETRYTVPVAGGAPRIGTLVDLLDITESDGRSSTLRAMDAVSARLSIGPEKETGVVDLAFRADDPALAEQVVDRLLALLNEFNGEIQRTRAAEEERFVAGRLNEAQQQLRSAEQLLQTFLERNASWQQSASLTFEHGRAQREVDIRREVYVALLRSRDEARINSVRDTPSITVIDAPTGSGKKQSRRLVFRTLAGGMVALAFGLFIAFVREGTRLGWQTNGDVSRA
jgi:uncharacterized protein involved in exopolysaccharide biosynthesis